MQQISFSGIMKHPDAIKEMSKQLMQEKHDAHSSSFLEHIGEMMEYWYPSDDEDIDNPNDFEGSTWEALSDSDKAAKTQKLANWRAEVLNVLTKAREINWNQDLYEISDTTRRHKDTEILNPDEVAMGAKPIYKVNRMILHNVANSILYAAFMRMIYLGKSGGDAKIDLKLLAEKEGQIRDLPSETLTKLNKTMQEVLTLLQEVSIFLEPGYAWYQNKSIEELHQVKDDMLFIPEEESEVTATGLVSQYSFSTIYSVLEKTQKKAYEERKEQERQAEREQAEADAKSRAKQQAEFNAFIKRMQAKQAAENQRQKAQQNKK